MRRALTSIDIEEANIHVIELSQVERATKGAELIAQDTAAMYVDITPYEEDLPILRRARVAVVIDHHTSVLDRMGRLSDSMQSLKNLCFFQDHHSAASLVAHQMRNLLEDKISDFDKKVALLRKKDVWEYALQKDWAREADLFRAFVGRGTDCTMDMMDEFLDDMPRCLEKGRAKVQAQLDASEALFAQIRCVSEQDGLRICVLQMHSQIEYDSKDLLKRCTARHITILLLVNSFEKGSVVNCIVKRTTDAVGDLGSFCRNLFESDKTVYCGGGGHPFAAGLQVNADHFDVSCICQDLLRLALVGWKASGHCKASAS